MTVHLRVAPLDGGISRCCKEVALVPQDDLVDS